jgi:hypothetical protein
MLTVALNNYGLAHPHVESGVNHSCLTPLDMDGIELNYLLVYKEIHNIK